MFPSRAVSGTALVAASALLLACGPARPGETEAEDAASFAALQDRGRAAMGVDQYTSTHLFDVLADGGRIELQRDTDDPEGVAVIRQHLQEIQRAFASGDFSTPAFVHDRPVPGTDVLVARRDRIEYVYRDLPRGGELRLITTDPDALEAIRAFMAFQRDDHRAGGVDHSRMDHSGMDHSGMDHSGMDHSGMDHSGMDHSRMDHSGRATDTAPPPSDPDAGALDATLPAGGAPGLAMGHDAMAPGSGRQPGTIRDG
jgi:hypothetical protein